VIVDEFEERLTDEQQGMLEEEIRKLKDAKKLAEAA
jgi:hypothetical protein